MSNTSKSSWRAPEKVKCLGTIGTREDLEPTLREHPSDRLPKHVVVFDEEDCFAVIGMVHVVCGRDLPLADRLVARREKKSYLGALTGLRLDVDGPARTGDQTVRRGQTHAGPFAERFGREERLEDAMERVS